MPITYDQAIAAINNGARVIDLSGHSLSLNQLTTLAYQLQANDTVETLNLSNTSLEYECLEPLASLFQINRSITSFIMKGNPMDTRNDKAEFVKQINDNPCLTTIEMNNKALGDRRKLQWLVERNIKNKNSPTPCVSASQKYESAKNTQQTKQPFAPITSKPAYHSSWQSGLGNQAEKDMKQAAKDYAHAMKEFSSMPSTNWSSTEFNPELAKQGHGKKVVQHIGNVCIISYVPESEIVPQIGSETNQQTYSTSQSIASSSSTNRYAPYPQSSYSHHQQASPQAQDAQSYQSPATLASQNDSFMPSYSSIPQADSIGSFASSPPSYQAPSNPFQHPTAFAATTFSTPTHGSTTSDVCNFQPKTKPARIWEMDPDTNISFAKKLLDEKKERYVLLPTTPKDLQKLTSYYMHDPVKGFDIRSAEVIYNPTFENAFVFEKDKLNNRPREKAFNARWKEKLTDPHLHTRLYVHQACEDLSIKEEDVSIFPLWHGTKVSKLESIFRTGIVNLSTTDDGYFGKASYGTPNAEYAYRVYATDAGSPNNAALLFAYGVVSSGFPVVATDNLGGKANYGNHDAHYMLVVPNSSNPNTSVYNACGNLSEAQNHQYKEIAFFQTAAFFPRYVVFLQPTWPKELSTKDANAYYDRAKDYLKNDDEQNALHYFQEAAKQGHVVACYLVALYYYHGQGVAQNYDVAYEHFQQCAKNNYLAAHFALGVYNEFHFQPNNVHTAAIHYSAAENHTSSQLRLNFKLVHRHPELASIAKNSSTFFAPKPNTQNTVIQQPTLGYKK